VYRTIQSNLAEKLYDTLISNSHTKRCSMTLKKKEGNEKRAAYEEEEDTVGVGAAEGATY